MRAMGVAVWIAVSMVMPVAEAQQSASVGERRVKVTIVPIDEVDVPAREAGVVVELKVRASDYVRRGDLLGQIDDHDAKSRLKAATGDLEIAKAQAASDAPVKAAEAVAEVAEAELLNSRAIDNQLDDAISKFELRRLEAAHKRAMYQAEVARVEQHVARLTLNVRQAQLEGVAAELERRRIVAPIDGVVERRYKHAGEWVNAGEPICHVLRMDRLQAEGLVEAGEFAPHELLGRQVEVIVRRARGEEERIPARIVHANSKISAGGLFIIRAEFRNPGKAPRWMVYPGMKGEIVLHLDRAGEDAAPTPTSR